MTTKKKVYKSTTDWERAYNRKESIKNIKLADTYTKRKFSGAVNALGRQGYLSKKSIDMIKHIYDVSGKGEKGVLIKHIVAGVQGAGRSKFIANLNLDIAKKGFGKVLRETKATLKQAKYKDNESNRYYAELAKAYVKGKKITKFDKIKIEKRVERQVYNSRMKAALTRPDLKDAIRKLIEDSLRAQGLL